MNNKFFKAAAAGIILSVSALTNIANAGLIDRGNGMIYDDVQDITWLQDANYAMTSGYDADGKMTWDESVAWAAGLEFGGYDDWRLFDASPNENCMGNATPGVGWKCYDNELAHLFYKDFGLTRHSQSIDLAAGDAEYELFTNMHTAVYWSGTEHATYSESAWVFMTYYGIQGWGQKDLQVDDSDSYNATYAWAVRDGDVGAVDAAVPEPATLAIFCLGLLGLVMRKRAN